MRVIMDIAAPEPPNGPAFGDGRELSLTRTIDASSQRVYETWTTRLREWWGPYGTTTPHCRLDLRAGGLFETCMRAADGTEFTTRGVFLEVVPDRRIVFTDAYTASWLPSAEPFFTAIISFEPLAPARMRYAARAMHWSVDQCRRHQRMGFHRGWGESTERLAACAMNTHIPS